MKHLQTFENFLNEGMSQKDIVAAAEKMKASEFIKHLDKKKVGYSMETGSLTNPDKGMLNLDIVGMKDGESILFIDGKYQGGNSSESTNESVLNEGSTLYISDPKFKDEASLKADILKKAGPALNDLLARQGVKYNPLTAKERGGNRISFDSKPMTGKDLGFMQYGFSEVYINIFSGGKFPEINKAAGENFEFEPYIWATLDYVYKHTNGGSNGCNLIFDGEDTNSIYYDIVGGKWLTQKEARNRKDWK